MRILLLAPQPFFQARGTPIAVKTVLEFLSSRGHVVDALTYHEGSDVDIPNCRIYRIPRLPGVRNVRPGFSAKKLLCDAAMVGSCARLMGRTRYDLVHAVEESAFIAAAMKAFTGVPYIYDMDSSLAEQMIDAFPRLGRLAPVLRRFEAIAVRRSAGVLTVCAALEDVAQRHAPGTSIGLVRTPPCSRRRRAPTAAPTCRRTPIGRPRRDVRGEPRALPGHRPAAGGLPAHAGPDARRQAGHRGWARRRHRPLRRAGHLARIGRAVHFLGPRPVSALADLLREADVLVSPRLKGLNTPMKIYSYMDSGTAVLATRLQTHTQVLDDRTAFLVEPEPIALGTGLATLLKDGVLREGLAARAKDHVQREFTPEAARRKLTSFYSMVEATIGARAARAGARA